MLTLLATLPFFTIAAADPAPPPTEPPPLPEPEAWVRQCLKDAPPATAVKDCEKRWANHCQDRPQGGTTVGITGCIATELKVWETLLAEVHVKLDAAAKRYDEYTPEGYSVQRSLNASKKAWEAFREAQCDYEYTEYIEGTMRGIVGVGCQLSLTTQRYEYLLSHGRQQNHFE